MTQKEFNEYIKQNRDQAKKIEDDLTKLALVIGTVPTDIGALKDFLKSFIKFKWESIGKVVNIQTLVGTSVAANAAYFNQYSEMLLSVKNNYDLLHGNYAGNGVNVIQIRAHIPFNGGVGTTIYKFYDVKTNKYLGGADL